MIELFGEIKDGELKILIGSEKIQASEPCRVMIKVEPLSMNNSQGQLNLLRTWLRIIGKETGRYWRAIYSDACFTNNINKEEPKDLNFPEMKAVLQEIEWMASEYEIVLPFPQKWDRRIK